MDDERITDVDCRIVALKLAISLTANDVMSPIETHQVPMYAEVFYRFMTGAPRASIQ